MADMEGIDDVAAAEDGRMVVKLAGPATNYLELSQLLFTATQQAAVAEAMLEAADQSMRLAAVDVAAERGRLLEAGLEERVAFVDQALKFMVAPNDASQGPLGMLVSPEDWAAATSDLEAVGKSGWQRVRDDRAKRASQTKKVVNGRPTST